MADFSLTTLFVVPVGQTTLPSTGSTQDLTAGQLGFFNKSYVPVNAGSIAASPYFYVAQGRQNTYLLGSKRSDKIASNGSNVSEWYKVSGSSVVNNQIIEISNFNVHAGEEITLTLRAHSSYLDTLYFNGFTRSVTVPAPCMECGDDPCDQVDTNILINKLIQKLTASTPGINPDNISLSKFYTFENVGGTILRITGKPLTKYGQPCDVAAFPYEYDRMRFKAFIYAGPDTTADFIVADNCNVIANVVTTQNSSYPTGVSEEISQMEKNYYSYQAGIMKHLFRKQGFNQNFESYVSAGTVYDTFYIKFNELDKAAYNFGDYIPTDAMVIIAVPAGSAASAAIEATLAGALGTVVDENKVTTTTTTTVAPTTTTTTTVAPTTTTTTTMP
jgi:hypothetical protein